MKVCTKCKAEKNESEFYRYSPNKGGLHNNCKECEKAAKTTPEARAKRRDYIQEYRRKPYVMKMEYESRLRYRKKNQRFFDKYNKKYILANPEKHKAHGKLEYALSVGRVKRTHCIICGNPKSEGHHDDYSKPYDVQWLCRKHHIAIHVQLKEIHNDVL